MINIEAKIWNSRGSKESRVGYDIANDFDLWCWSNALLVFHQSVELDIQTTGGG